MSTSKRDVNKLPEAGTAVAQADIGIKFEEDARKEINTSVDKADMGAEINISLLESKALKQILDAFKLKRNPYFSAYTD
ncbi:MAG: hypothetical protein ACI9ES_002585 [Oceanospirillaceae bacterium]|jgi:hypothetical protein